MGAAALALVAASACRSGAPAAPSPHGVRYRLAWSTEGVDRDADGRGFALTSDLGYRVRVTRGWATTYSTELVECPREPAAWSPFTGVAFAGHSTGTPNPAAVKAMRVESLTDPTDGEAGAVTLAPQAYCQLHYLLARAAREATGLPADVDMVDTTLHVDGTYRAPDAAADTAFSVHTASAYGQLFGVQVDTGREHADVVIRRRLARMFDGVDFARMPEKAVGLQILRSLVDHVTVEVRRRDADR
jgi:hypothetical protein